MRRQINGSGGWDYSIAIWWCCGHDDAPCTRIHGRTLRNEHLSTGRRWLRLTRLDGLTGRKLALLSLMNHLKLDRKRLKWYSALKLEKKRKSKVISTIFFYDASNVILVEGDRDCVELRVLSSRWVFPVSYATEWTHLSPLCWARIRLWESCTWQGSAPWSSAECECKRSVVAGGPENNPPSFRKHETKKKPPFLVVGRHRSSSAEIQLGPASLRRFHRGARRGNPQTKVHVISFGCCIGKMTSSTSKSRSNVTTVEFHFGSQPWARH